MPDFVAGSWLIVATVGHEIVGCARVEPTPTPFPVGRLDGVPELDADRRNEWLAGGTELVELVVHPAARGHGVGSLLEATARSAAREQRSWVVLTDVERAAVPFFLRRGWTPRAAVTQDRSRPVVLLPSSHPAVRGCRPGG
ncbi:MAG: GNAT family N-acetyltransferase [Pseudonocardia sp.]|nr:GNAT family N-acetyltransferase [Pseudonocardia sp.]